MSIIDKAAAFPMEWNEWYAQWREWRDAQLRAGRLQASGYCFPTPNMLADDVLGVWRAGHENVELSEVTFLGARGVGITYGTASGTHVPDGGVVHSFAELERVLAETAGVTFD